MKDYEIINVQYYDPRQPNIFVKSTRSDREFVKYYFCNNKENCDLYKNKSCVLKTGLWGGSCPYGKISQTDGFTKAARKCGDLIKKAKETPIVKASILVAIANNNIVFKDKSGLKSQLSSFASLNILIPI